MKYNPLALINKHVFCFLFILLFSQSLYCQYNYAFERAYDLHKQRDRVLASPYYELAILEINNIFTPSNYQPEHRGITDTLIWAMSNLARCNYDLGYDELAESQLRATISMLSMLKAKGYENYIKEARAHFLLGKLLERNNDFPGAQTEYIIASNSSKELVRTTGLKSDDLPDIYTDLSKMMLYFQQPEEVIRVGEEAISNIPMFKYATEISMVYHNLGGAYLLTGDYEKAEDYYKKTDTLFRNNPNFPENPRLLVNYLNLQTDFGLLYGRMMRFQQALDSLSVAEQQALLNSEALGSELNEVLASIKLNQGLVYQLQADFPKAISYYQEAITKNLKQALYSAELLQELASQGADNSILLLSENVPELVESLLGIAQSYNSLNSQDSSAVFLSLALNTLQEANRDFFDAQTRLRMASLSRAVHEAAIEFYAASDPILAYQYCSSGKYQVLFEDLIRRRVLEQELSETAYEEWLNLQEEYRQLRDNYLSDPSASTLDEIRQARRKLVQLTQTAEESQRMAIFRSSVVDFQKLRTELLEEDQHLVEYFLGQDRLYIFYVSKEHSVPQIDTVGISRFEIEGLVTRWRIALMDEEALEEFDELSMELYRILIAPVRAKMEGEKILIVSDGILSLLPFGALFDQLPENIPDEYTESGLMPYVDYPYLARTYQISYSYSLAKLEQAKMQTLEGAQRRKMLALVVDESYQQQIDRLNDMASGYLQSFPMTKIKGGTGINLVDTLRNASQEFSQLLLVTHGTVVSSNPDLSWILLTNGQDTIHLTLAQLYSLDLDFEMIVTSACEIGVGKLNQGEGLISLARGFTQAGAHSLITSLWKITGDANTDLIPTYYQGLETGASKDAALQYAVETLFKERPSLTHPRYWAGMIPIGNMAPIVDAGFSWWFWVLIAGLLGFTLYFLYDRYLGGKSNAALR